LEELGDFFCDIMYKSLKIGCLLYIMDIESLHPQGISQIIKMLKKSSFITMDITKIYISIAHNDLGDNGHSFIA
jgi:hypothetical protein